MRGDSDYRTEAFGEEAVVSRQGKCRSSWPSGVVTGLVRLVCMIIQALDFIIQEYGEGIGVLSRRVMMLFYIYSFCDSGIKFTYPVLKFVFSNDCLDQVWQNIPVTKCSRGQGKTLSQKTRLGVELCSNVHEPGLAFSL